MMSPEEIYDNAFMAALDAKLPNPDGHAANAVYQHAAADRDRLRALNAVLLEALEPFCLHNVSYVGNEIRISTGSHDAAMRMMQLARAAIAKARLAPLTETGE